VLFHQNIHNIEELGRLRMNSFYGNRMITQCALYLCLLSTDTLT